VVPVVPPDDFGDDGCIEVRELYGKLAEALALLVEQPDPSLGLLVYFDRSIMDMAFVRRCRVAAATPVRFPHLSILVYRRLHRQRRRPHRFFGATIADHPDALIAVLVRFFESRNR